MGRDVLEQIADLRRRKNNLKPRELEAVARAARWVHDRTTGSHAVYVKEGVREPLVIPRHLKLRGLLAIRLLNRIEDSIRREEGRDDP